MNDLERIQNLLKQLGKVHAPKPDPLKVLDEQTKKVVLPLAHRALGKAVVDFRHAEKQLDAAYAQSDSYDPKELSAELSLASAQCARVDSIQELGAMFESALKSGNRTRIKAFSEVASAITKDIARDPVISPRDKIDAISLERNMKTSLDNLRQTEVVASAQKAFDAQVTNMENTVSTLGAVSRKYRDKDLSRALSHVDIKTTYESAKKRSYTTVNVYSPQDIRPPDQLGDSSIESPVGLPTRKPQLIRRVILGTDEQGRPTRIVEGGDNE